MTAHRLVMRLVHPGRCTMDQTAIVSCMALLPGQRMLTQQQNWSQAPVCTHQTVLRQQDQHSHQAKSIALLPTDLLKAMAPLSSSKWVGHTLL